MSVSTSSCATTAGASSVNRSKRRGITTETALRLARFFGGDAQSWLNLQQTYDLKMAEKTFLKAIAKEVKPLAALDTKLALTA